MQEREAKLLLKAGDIQNVVIEHTPDKRGWTVRLREQNGNSHFLVSKRGESARIFRTSDAALRCCMRIGFSQVEVSV